MYFYYSLGMTQTPKLTAKVILENFPSLFVHFEILIYKQFLRLTFIYSLLICTHPQQFPFLFIFFYLCCFSCLFFSLTTYFIPVLKFAQNISHNITPSISVIFSKFLSQVQSVYKDSLILFQPQQESIIMCAYGILMSSPNQLG